MFTGFKNELQNLTRAVELQYKFVEFSKTYGCETEQHWLTSKIVDILITVVNF